MSTILLITSSPRAESLSTRVATELAETIAARTPGGTVVHRDVGVDPLPHIDALFASAIRKPVDARTAAEAAAAAPSDALVAELLAADAVVIGTGLINFGVYSGLKTWIDHVARAGLTFRYTEKGPEGLVKGKAVYVVLASGGVYSSGAAAALDHATPYLRSVLGFMGMTDVEVIHVEGLAFGPEAVEKALGAARARTEAVALAA